MGQQRELTQKPPKLAMPPVLGDGGAVQDLSLPLCSTVEEAAIIGNRSASLSSCGSLSTTEGHTVLPPPPVGGLRPKVLVINLAMQILSSTIVGIGAQMKRGGWLLTPVLVSGAALIVWEMTRLVSSTIDALRLQENAEIRAYQDFAAGAFGAKGRWLASATSTLDLVGAICIGLVLCASNCQEISPINLPWPPTSLGDASVAPNGRKWWVLLLSSTTAVFSFMDLGHLADYSAKAGPFVSGLCITLALCGCACAVMDMQDFPPSCFGDTSEPYWWPGLDTAPGFASQVAGISSYSFYCFAVVVTVPALKVEMADPRKLVPAASCSFLLCVVFFVMIMSLGYLGFGNLGPDNLISGMRTNRPDGWWALSNPWSTGVLSNTGHALSLLMVTNSLLIDATYVPCAILAIERSAPHFFVTSLRRFVLRICVIFFRFLVATEVASFVALSSLSASLFCVMNNVMLPLAAFHKVKPENVSLPRKLLHGAVFLFGCFVMVFGTYSAISAMLRPEEAEAAPTLRPGVSTACEADYNAAVGHGILGVL